VVRVCAVDHLFQSSRRVWEGFEGSFDNLVSE